MINLIDKAKAATSILDNIHVPLGNRGEGEKALYDLTSVGDSIAAIIRIMLDAIGYLAALYFLYGAFMYIISYGNEAKAGKAKQTMTWAILGVIIAVLARLLVGVIADTFSSNPDNSNALNSVNTQPQ